MRCLRWSLLLAIVAAHALVSQASYPRKTGRWRIGPLTVSIGSVTKENTKQFDDTILGNFTLVGGVRGKGIKFDGFTTRITRDAHSAPAVEGAATFEAWIAPQAYPWNWGAIVERKNRYFFGLDATGHVGLRVYIDNQWRECVSGTQVPFMQWSHVAATFDPKNGLIALHQRARLRDASRLPDIWMAAVELSRSAGTWKRFPRRLREKFQHRTRSMASSTN